MATQALNVTLAAEDRASLSMAVACCAFIWRRDEQLARHLRSQVMVDYDWTAEQWDGQVAAMADYTRRQSDNDEDVKQFLRVGFCGEAQL